MLELLTEAQVAALAQVHPRTIRRLIDRSKLPDLEKRKERARERSREWYEVHKEQIRSRRRAYREAHKEQMRGYMKVYNKTHKERLRKQSREYRYGVTPEMYEGLSREQSGRCAICRQSPIRRHLAVDHCHDTGVIRGLLCHRCNTAIGLLRNDAAKCRHAAEYLEKGQSKPLESV
jgi:hypothetical protein